MHSRFVAEAAQSPLLPKPAELIVGAIAFGLLFLVLRKFVTPMFEKAFAARTEAIQGGIEKAERAQLEAAKALESYTAQLADARGEASKIREEARVQGAAIIEDLRAQAQEEAARITAAAHSSIEAEREKAITSLRLPHLLSALHYLPTSLKHSEPSPRQLDYAVH